MLVGERGLHDLPERAERRAGGDGVGGVGRDQERRAVAAAQRAFELGRYLDAEQRVAGLEQLVELRLVAHLARDLEVARVLQRLEDDAADIAVLLEQHRGRQVARHRVDGVAEQQKLHQRDGDHGGERDAVAPQLQELLEQHGAGAPPEAEGDDAECAHGHGLTDTCPGHGPSAR